MNAPQIHLMMNHIPVLGMVFGAVILGAGLVWRTSALLRAGLVTLFLVALAGLPVFFSGEPAEESIEHAAGVSRDTVHAHENAAKISVVGLAVVGLAALGGLARFRRREVSRGFATFVLMAVVAAGGVLAWTAHLGGQIRHPEIAGGAASNEPASAAPERESD